jgi:ADP-ribosyl-[dinitrogen reductase] hydrolase
MSDSNQLKRARGVLWGQAVGDALGTTVEFERAEHIASKHPRGVREVVGGGPFELEAGQITDDTELALCLARSLALHHRYDEDDAASRYIAWCRGNPPDCGGTTRRAFGQLTPKDVSIAAAVRARALRDSQANGALMRVSPLAIFGSTLDPETLHELAAADASLSHPHDVCVAANQVFCFAISSALRTGATGPEVFETTLAFARSTLSCTEAIPTLELARLELPADAFANMGWVRHALQAAFHQLLHARDFEQALVDVVGLGGDTDTNGCITGALLGSVFGVDAIPERWTKVVRECRPHRPEQFWCHDLDALALSLLQRA